jgi:hypothetical protein
MKGSKFRGASEASGGNSSQNSASDCPVVQLRSIESEQILFLSSASWQTNSFVSLPVTDFPAGYALATAFVNGIPSASSILRILPGSSLVPPLPLADGGLQFSFTSTPGSIFTAIATTNVSLDLSNWTVLGVVPEVSSGRFLFTDHEATNYPQRFYRVRSP